MNDFSSVVEVTRAVEFDAGHRVPHHHGRCAHLHGHRYRLEVTIAGQLVANESASDHGMVADFQAIQKLILEHIVDLWDHAFLVYEKDPVFELLQKIPDHRTVVLDCSPTVENLARIAFQRLREACKQSYGDRIALKRVRLYETPNCWSDVMAEN